MMRAFTILIVAIMSLVLLVFTASRTLDLLQLFLPAGQAVFAYLALVAFDGGAPRLVVLLRAWRTRILAACDRAPDGDSKPASGGGQQHC